MPNCLSSHPSLYLQQHANQKIEWMTWSKKAFEKAKLEDKPILLSIGYSSCHWCQQMSKDCFDDEYVAKLMNRHFVSILVDREDRPDLDHIYMEAIRMFDQSAGWPLNVFCLPDGRPFWGGTYFPKEDLGNGLAPWPQVLIRIAEHYRTGRNDLVENAENVTANLFHSNHADYSSEDLWDPSLIVRGAEEICSFHDDKFGGFSKAPKFPSPMKIEFLLSSLETTKVRNNSKFSSRITSCLNKTLQSLSKYGIFDHVAGGFFRYCTDREWSSPHYEKMVTDNALLVSAFSQAYRKFKDQNYALIIRKTLSWLNDEMGSTDIGYGSSMSADANGKEGDYYLWKKDAMVEAVGEVGKSLYNSLPKQENALVLPQFIDPDILDEQTQLSCFDKLKKNLTAKAKPIVDKKRILSANSLITKCFVEAGISLGEEDLLREAIKLESWISDNFTNSDYNLKSVLYPEDHSLVTSGNLDDYVFYAEALLSLASISELVESGSSQLLINKSSRVITSVMAHFRDTSMPGYFYTKSDLLPPPPARKKIWHDTDIPAGNSTLIKIFSSLFHLQKDDKWKLELNKITSGYTKVIRSTPAAAAKALKSLCDQAMGEISILFPKGSENQLLDRLKDFPNRSFFLKPNGSDKNEYGLQVGSLNEVLKCKDLDSLIELINE